MSVTQIQFDALAMTPLESSMPEQKCVDFGTVVLSVLAFDDTTEEYANKSFEIPQNLDTSGTVTFRAQVSPATGAASKNVALTFGHRAVGDGEAIDGAYTDEDSGDKAITATTGNKTMIEWTETVTNLGWSSKDDVFFRISRPQASSNNLVGDMYWIRFTIDIPIT